MQHQHQLIHAAAACCPRPLCAGDGSAPPGAGPVAGGGRAVAAVGHSQAGGPPGSRLGAESGAAYVRVLACIRMHTIYRAVGIRPEIVSIRMHTIYRAAGGGGGPGCGRRRRCWRSPRAASPSSGTAQGARARGTGSLNDQHVIMLHPRVVAPAVLVRLSAGGGLLLGGSSGSTGWTIDGVVYHPPQVSHGTVARAGPGPARCTHLGAELGVGRWAAGRTLE
jgi:hypothetical protein